MPSITQINLTRLQVSVSKLGITRLRRENIRGLMGPSQSSMVSACCRMREASSSVVGKESNRFNSSESNLKLESFGSLLVWKKICFKLTCEKTIQMNDYNLEICVTNLLQF